MFMAGLRHDRFRSRGLSMSKTGYGLVDITITRLSPFLSQIGGNAATCVGNP